MTNQVTPVPAVEEVTPLSNTAGGGRAPSPETIVYDPFVARFREVTAGLIAGIIVAGAMLMLIVALWFIQAPQNDATFGRVKDLLLYINPLLGVVLGYYFSKVTIEARAENAEQTAQTASVAARAAGQTALAATEAAQQAEQDRQVAQAQAQQATLSLRRIVPLASQFVPPAGNQSALLGGSGQQGGPQDPLAGVRRELQAALEDARRLPGIS